VVSDRAAEVGQVVAEHAVCHRRAALVVHHSAAVAGCVPAESAVGQCRIAAVVVPYSAAAQATNPLQNPIIIGKNLTGGPCLRIGFLGSIDITGAVRYYFYSLILVIVFE
jgi:hypothetical protein